MPQRILYLDPFSGISGDMTVGALLDLGADFEHLRRELDRLPVRGYGVSAGKCVRAGITATKFDVHVHTHHAHGHSHPHRAWRDIRDMIGSSTLSAWVKDKAHDAFARLAEAEGAIHGKAPEDVHFHEVGGVDAIVDVVGTMIAVEQLLPLRIFSSSVNVGRGVIQCAHGIYPAPGPATERLLQGIPVFSNEVAGELTTPTGATLLVTLVDAFAPRPPMTIRNSGYGAGTRETEGNANVLRMTLGEESAEAAAGAGRVVVIEATVDDMSPQLCGYFMERAFAEGALDVFFTPVQMKKNRPAVNLTVLCAPDLLNAMARLILTETTSIGIRYTSAERQVLDRRLLRVPTPYGEVAAKLSYLDGQMVNAAPEYEDCRRLASDAGVPLKQVLAAAVEACNKAR
jgi:uncharacterized protein (TIGR00299 family) protein